MEKSFATVCFVAVIALATCSNNVVMIDRDHLEFKMWQPYSQTVGRRSPPGHLVGGGDVEDQP